MGGANIEKIQRIQNLKLWRVFQKEVEEVKKKNGGEAKLEDLFNGTRYTPPK